MRVPEFYKPPDDRPAWQFSAWFAEPYVGMLVRIGGHGATIVVQRWHGAANVGVTLYRVLHRRLVPLAFPWRFQPTELNLFGSVGTGDTQVDCTSQLLVLESHWYDARGQHTRRVAYRLVGSRFRSVRHTPRFRFGSPFAHCLVVRGQAL